MIEMGFDLYVNYSQFIFGPFLDYGDLVVHMSIGRERDKD